MTIQGVGRPLAGGKIRCKLVHEPQGTAEEALQGEDCGTAMPAAGIKHRTEGNDMRSTFVALATVSADALCASTSLAVAQQSMESLIAAAKAEGQLTTIALPHDWCNYGELIQSYKTKYGM